MACGSNDRWLAFVERCQRPNPVAGVFSDLTDLQLWKLFSARAGRVAGVDPGDADAVAGFVGISRAALDGHEQAERAAGRELSILGIAYLSPFG